MVAVNPEDTSLRETGYGSAVAQTSVRMPDDLLSRARESAKRDGVSLNLWLCTAIAERLAGSLRQEDRDRLQAVEDRLEALEKRFR